PLPRGLKRRLSRFRNPRRARVASWFRFLRPAKGLGDAALKERLRIDPPEYLDQFRRHPDWTPPIRVAAEHASVRLRWKVINSVFLALGEEHKGMLRVTTRQRADSVRAEEL